MEAPPDAHHPAAAAAAGGGSGSVAGESEQHQSKLWQGVPRLLRQAQQLLNDPVLLAFAQLPAVSTRQQQQQQVDAAGMQGSIAAAGIVNSLRLNGRWSGLPAAAAPQAAATAARDAGATDGLGQGDDAVAGLPANVHLLTLMRAEEGDPTRLIVRLAHNFQVWCKSAQQKMQTDDAAQERSQPAHIDLPP
jgi:hypothetical protein